VLENRAEKGIGRQDRVRCQRQEKIACWYAVPDMIRMIKQSRKKMGEACSAYEISVKEAEWKM
jgi:hypothetical protein